MELDCDWYNGVQMNITRIQQLQEAQDRTTARINGSIHYRVRYGDEEDDWGRGVVYFATIVRLPRGSITCPDAMWSAALSAVVKLSPAMTGTTIMRR